MTSFELAIAAITAVVALYGAILSTYNLSIERRKQVPRVRVKVALGNQHPDGMELFEARLFLNAANDGQCAVTIANCGLRIKGGEEVVVGHQQRDIRLPVEVPPGKSCTIELPAAAIGSYARGKNLPGELEWRAFFQDSLGNRYWSRSQRVDVSPYFPDSRDESDD